MLSRDSSQAIRAERRAERLKSNNFLIRIELEFRIRIVNKPILTVNTFSLTVRLRQLWHGRSYVSASITRKEKIKTCP
uniref:Uncharacterized protein n=1 Tax=Wuchereria bancrofti TaxID=6293 RepID=A0AAF5PYL7_WUCBA